MGNGKTDDNLPDAGDETGESTLRGDALDGSEQKRSVDHAAFEKKRNPDTTVRVDDEEDTLYSDGLEVEDDTPPLISPDNVRTR
jgi:hypothetical protein